MGDRSQLSLLPIPTLSPTRNGFSRSATVGDFRRGSCQPTPEPSPQAWLASSKRRARPGALDPPASPLEMLSPVTEPLDAAQWNKRMSLLTHRYLREYGVDREDAIVDKAFRTLGLFCVGDEAKQSLEKFKVTFARLSITSLEKYRINPLERSSSWISFPSFLDDSFNLSHTSLSMDQRPIDIGTLSDITRDVNNSQSQTLSRNSNKRSSFQNLDKINLDDSPSNTTMSGRENPRYMTPTLASKAQNNTVQPHSRPTTPASAGSGTEKRNWITNAGRRMGLTTPKSKKGDRPADRPSTGGRSPDILTAAQKKLPMKDKNNKVQGQPATGDNDQAVERDLMRVHEASMNGQRSPTHPQAPLEPQSGIPRLQRKESPPDKPLPSLPFASVRPRSPIIRRSIIDASERPLRKSLSPSPGVEFHEEWPAILPSSSVTPNTAQPVALKSSIEVGTISFKQFPKTLTKAEGRLDETKDKDNPIDSAPDHSRPALRKLIAPHAEMAKEEEQLAQAGETFDTTSVQDMPAGAASGERRGHPHQPHSIRQPRQTKTSMMRARLSSGTNHLPEDESQPVDQDSISAQFPSLHDLPKAKAGAVPPRLSVPGPVRSHSRTRQQVSAQNSPYGLGRRGPMRQVKSDVCTGQPQASSQDEESLNGKPKSGAADLIAFKQFRGSGIESRKSFIPIRRRAKETALEDSEGDVLIEKPMNQGARKGGKEDSEKAENDGRLLDFSDSFVTSSGTISVDPLQRLVLVLYLRRTGEYLLPKGRKNVGETLQAAAIRETREESGYLCRLRKHNLPTRACLHNVSKHSEPVAVQQRKVQGTRKMIFWYLAEVDSLSSQLDGTQEEGEDFETCWVPFENAPSRMSFAEDREIVEQALEAVNVDTDREGSLVHHKAMRRDTDARAAEQSKLNSKPATADVPVSSREADDVVSATITQVEIQPSTITLSSTAVEEDESLSLNIPNESDILSLRDFAASDPGNYRVKRLSHAAPGHGPTLRIAEDAEKILFGANSEEEDTAKELGAMGRSNTVDLRKSTVIKEQLKASKERIMKGPLSRSTTSRSVSKIHTQSDTSLEHLLPAVEGGPTDSLDTIARLGLNASGVARSTNDVDPFVSGYLPLEGPEAEYSCPKSDLEWPFKDVEKPPRDTETVSEHVPEEEDSWISPLATAVAQNNGDGTTPATRVPNNTPATKDIHDFRQVLNEVSEVQNPLMAAIIDPKAAIGTTSLEGQGRPRYPTRISSRTHFQEIVRERNDKDGRISTRQSHSPEIPNRFASVRSQSRSKPTRTAPAYFTRSETVMRTDGRTSTNVASSLRARRAPDSTRAQLSTTKGMLSNFRGLFNKRSLENAGGSSGMGYSGSVRGKNAKVGKDGSPFPRIGAPVPSHLLSTEKVRGNTRGTPTPPAIGRDRTTKNTPPAFLTPVAGDTQYAESLAGRVLDSAMAETNAQKKAKLGQLGQFMVEAVTASKDAEKAMEEARQAATMAEVHSMDAKRCLWHVSEMVETILAERQDES